MTVIHCVSKLNITIHKSDLGIVTFSFSYCKARKSHLERRCRVRLVFRFFCRICAPSVDTDPE